jgi:hypothetical protein
MSIIDDPMWAMTAVGVWLSLPLAPVLYSLSPLIMGGAFVAGMLSPF